MSDFLGLSKNLMWNKWNLMNTVIGIDLIATIVITLVSVFTGTPISASYVLGAFAFTSIVAYMVGFVLLARNNERVYTSNNYRLLPVSSTKLYFGNLITTLGGLLYFWIIASVIGGLILSFASRKFLSMNGSVDMNQDWNAIIAFNVMLLLITLVIWSGITLVHFLTNMVSGFLPFGRQKFVMFIIYLLVIWAAMATFNFTTGNLVRMFLSGGITSIGTISSMSGLTRTTWISCGIFSGWLVVFTVINIYLLKRWTETKR